MQDPPSRRQYPRPSLVRRETRHVAGRSRLCKDEPTVIRPRRLTDRFTSWVEGGVLLGEIIRHNHHHAADPPRRAIAFFVVFSVAMIKVLA